MFRAGAKIAGQEEVGTKQFFILGLRVSETHGMGV